MSSKEIQERVAERTAQRSRAARIKAIVEEAEALKEKGNEHFRKAEYLEATIFYRRANALRPHEPSYPCNAALASLKLGFPLFGPDACEYCHDLRALPDDWKLLQKDTRKFSSFQEAYDLCSRFQHLSSKDPRVLPNFVKCMVGRDPAVQELAAGHRRRRKIDFTDQEKALFLLWIFDTQPMQCIAALCPILMSQCTIYGATKHNVCHS